MGPQTRHFQFILGISLFGFVAIVALLAIVFRAEGVPLWAPLPWVALGGSLFAAVCWPVISPLRRAFAYPFATCADPEDAEQTATYQAALQAIGGAPLLALVRLFLMVVLFTVAVGIWGLGMGLEGAARVEFALLILSFGMLAASFVYVISDRLSLKTLLEASLSCYPAQLRENRQQRKIFIIPVFMSLMSLLFAFATAFLLADRGAENGWGIVGSAVALSVFYLSIVTVLVANWNSNTALLYKSVLIQLDQLTQAERNLTGRISIGSVDEIGSISGRVNAFCEGLSDGLRRVASTHSELASVQQNLFQGIGTATGAASDIAVSITAASAAIERAEAALAESLANARELAVHTADAAQKIGDQSTRVASSTEGIQKVMEAVRRLAAEVTTARTQTEDLNRVVVDGEQGLKSLVETVKAVSQRSVDLEKVNKLIAGVAARTNLLAMNAAIEAAHAGDAGRGFSVVAEEIRTLAESTADHTRHSRQSLTAILDLIGQALRAAEAAGTSFSRVRTASEAVAQVTSGVAAAMGAEEQRSAGILSLLAETEALGRSVAASTQALDTLAEATAHRLESATSDQNQAQGLARTMTDRNQDLAQAMTQVNALSEKTAEINGKLAAFLSSFRT